MADTGDPQHTGDAGLHLPGAGDGHWPYSLLIVDGDEEEQARLQQWLAPAFLRVDTAADTLSGKSLLQQHRHRVLILGADLRDRNGMVWLRELQQQDAPPLTVVLTEGEDQEALARATRAGATDFLLRPVKWEDLRGTLRRLLGAGSVVSHPHAEPTLPPRGTQPEQRLVGDSKALRRLLGTLERVAPTPVTLLLCGPTGTGKELIGRLSHDLSGRTGPFVPVNCGAVTPDLAESEFFGHAKGAFTGASQPRQGLFRYADGGTLFLDEISEMPMDIQAKLLRVLEEGAIRPVGAHRELPVNARVVAATNRDLARAVELGNFREDLYYRLNVLNLWVPPLRDRPEDIPPLARHFATNLAVSVGRPPPELSERCMERLQAHQWPGNVRELKHVMERAVHLGVPPEECIQGPAGETADPGSGSPPSEYGDYPTDLPLKEVERRHALRVLGHCAGNKSEAARRLGIGRKTLERKLQSWGAPPPPATP